MLINNICFSSVDALDSHIEFSELSFQRSSSFQISKFWVQNERSIKTGISNPAPGELLSCRVQL